MQHSGLRLVERIIAMNVKRIDCFELFVPRNWNGDYHTFCLHRGLLRFGVVDKGTAGVPDWDKWDAWYVFPHKPSRR